MTSLPAMYDIESYHYDLPGKNIAQKPAARRDDSRLFVLGRDAGHNADRCFRNIPDYLNPGDLLVVNNTRVFPARLLGRKESGGRVELFLLEYPRMNTPKNGSSEPKDGRTGGRIEVSGLLKSSKRPRPGTRLLFGPGLEGTVEEIMPDGKARVMLSYEEELDQVLAAHGKVPLPPYIRRGRGEMPWDRKRYQTVYARQPGAVAAPTAGLHFTDELLSGIREKGVGVTGITLHVGYGTFAPVRERDIRKHHIHREWLKIPAKTAGLINHTRKTGGKIWAVGTTTVRSLEFAADTQGKVQALEEWCGLYIYPGYRFKVVDNLITNFHLPRSSLLFLVCALAGRERVLHAYEEAVRLGYRFYSYGDAMAVIT